MSEIRISSQPLEPVPKAIVIGASSGIGAAVVKELASQGYQVAALARREQDLKTLCETVNSRPGNGRAFYRVHDVTNFSEIPGTFQDVVHELGGLDLIVYAAGIQLPVRLDEFNFSKDKAMMDVNVLGAMAWLNETAVRFERAGNGHIVGIGSVAGDRGRIASPGYNTSKAALSTYLEALRNRLSRHGVTVTTVKPGFVDTILLENAPKTFWVISPEKAAASIYQAIRGRKQTVYVPARWRWVMLIIRHIPSFIFRRMNF